MDTMFWIISGSFLIAVGVYVQKGDKGHAYNKTASFLEPQPDPSGISSVFFERSMFSLSEGSQLEFGINAGVRSEVCTNEFSAPLQASVEGL